MLDLLERKFADLGTASGPVLMVVIAVVFLLVLAVTLRRPLRRWREQHQIERSIRRLGAARMQRLRLPDGVGGELTIDNLLLRPEGLLIVGVKRYPGMIYGADNISEWTQILKGRSFKFPNPFTHLQDQINALKGIVPGVPVRALSLFAHHASFPKDKPGSVLLLSEARARGKKFRREDVPQDLWDAWERLTEMRTRGVLGAEPAR
jgi:hypothetical protein